MVHYVSCDNCKEIFSWDCGITCNKCMRSFCGDCGVKTSAECEPGYVFNCEFCKKKKKKKTMEKKTVVKGKKKPDTDSDED